MAYAKINSVTNANMAKVSSAAKAALGKIGSIDAPSAGFADDYSILLDGVDDHMTVDGAGSVISGDLGSVSIWFTLDTYAHTAWVMEAAIDGDSDNVVTIYYHGGTDQTRFIHSGGGSETTIYATTAVENNGWHHLVCTWDTSSNASIMYIDGSSVATGAAADFTGTIDEIDFGKRRGSAWLQWPGNFNDIAFFDDVLTAGEVSTIYNSGDPKDESSHSGLVGYWKMEENTGTSVADSSSNSNAMTLVNGAAFEAETP